MDSIATPIPAPPRDWAAHPPTAGELAAARRELARKLAALFTVQYRVDGAWCQALRLDPLTICRHAERPMPAAAVWLPGYLVWTIEEARGHMDWSRKFSATRSSAATVKETTVYVPDPFYPARRPVGTYPTLREAWAHVARLDAEARAVPEMRIVMAGDDLLNGAAAETVESDAPDQAPGVARTAT